MNWYEVRVVLERTIENGQTAKVKEDYLVQAVNVTDAETRIIEELKEVIKGEFEIDSVKKKKIAEMMEAESGDVWHKVRVSYVTINEKNGEEKKKAETMMVKAVDVFEAVDTLRKGMKGTMSDWELSSVAETAIVEAFYITAEAEEEK